MRNQRIFKKDFSNEFLRVFTGTILKWFHGLFLCFHREKALFSSEASFYRRFFFVWLLVISLAGGCASRRSVCSQALSSLHPVPRKPLMAPLSPLWVSPGFLSLPALSSKWRPLTVAVAHTLSLVWAIIPTPDCSLRYPSCSPTTSPIPEKGFYLLA